VEHFSHPELQIPHSESEKRLMSFQARIRRNVIPAALVGALVVAGANPAAAQSLGTTSPDSFNASGASIAGWTWLRSPGNSATWHFPPVRGGMSQPCINFTMLATNGANGGSGHSASIRVLLTGAGAARPVPAVLRLTNPFRPIVTSDTGGVGYQAWGSVCSPALRAIAAGGVTVEMQWSPTVGNHVAVRQDSALLAYVR